MAMTTLKWPDYLILVAFLLCSLGIGFYHSVTGGRQRTTQEFIMANRKLGIVPTALSLFVSFQSAIMILGATAEMYLFGVQYMVWTPVAFTLSTILVERIMVPWIYPLKLVSINDYLEQRFESRAVRILGTLIGILGAILYMGVAMYAPSAALESATGLPTTVSIPLMAVVSIAYTAMGGMRAVIWTDVFQFLILMGGMLAILIKGIVINGGISNVMDLCRSEGRMIVADWSPDPTVRHTVWGFLIGWSINWMKVYGLAQASVQRISATETLVKARITMLLNIPGLIILYVTACAIGLCVLAYYSSIRCDPLVNEDVSSPNQLLSLFVTTIFSNSQGFAGLFLATLYGGALSSVSSSLSGSAAQCWEDILKDRLSAMQEHRKAIVNKMLVVTFGSVATAVAFLAAVIPGPITQVAMTFGSAVGGPIYGVFVLGGLSKYGNWKGALAGGISSLCINLWLSLGAFSLHRRLSVLPPLSIGGCADPSEHGYNSTWFLPNVTSMTSSNDYVTSMSYVNSTNYMGRITEPVETLTLLQRFYSLSYVWYSLFSVLMTVFIGTVVSLMFRDRDAESRVADRLLIPFNQVFSWSDARSTSNGTSLNGKVDIGLQATNNNDAKETDRMLVEMNLMKS